MRKKTFVPDNVKYLIYEKNILTFFMLLLLVMWSVYKEAEKENVKNLRLRRLFREIFIEDHLKFGLSYWFEFPDR